MNAGVHDTILQFIENGLLEGDIENIDCSPIYIGTKIGQLVPEDVLSVKYLINFVSKYKNDDLVTRMLTQLKSHLIDVDDDVEVFAALINNLLDDDRDIFIIWDK